MFNRFTAFKFLKSVGHRPIFWLGGPILLYLWTIPGPFVFDDLNLLRKTERFIEGKRDRLELFRFAPTDEDWLTMRSRGTYPWWSPDSRRIDFQRPIAEWSFWLDVKLFGRNPIGPRIESLGLFAVALLLVYRLFLSAGTDSLRAGLGTFFLGISQCLAQPVAFVSNRSDLFVLIGIALAGHAYFRLNRHASPARGIVGLAGFVLALLAKEPAVAFAGVVVIHALATSRRRAEFPASPAQRWYATAVASTAAIYLFWYMQSSHGTLGELDAAWLMARLRSLTLYPCVWVIGLPIAILPQLPESATSCAIAAGIVCWMAMAFVIFRQWRNGRRGILFFALWALAFMAPALLTIPESRAISIATVGWAWILVGILMPDESSASQIGRPSIWTRQWFLATNGIVSVCCCIGTLYMMQRYELDARDHLRRIVEQLDAPLNDGDCLVVLEADTPFELICAGDRLSVVTNRQDVRTIFLTMRGADASVIVDGPRTSMIRGAAPQLFDTPAHRLTLGAGYRPHIGDTFELADFSFEVANLNDKGEVVALRLRIHDDADVSRLRTFPANLFGQSLGGPRRDAGRRGERSDDP
ncbi:MAG: hypothetical protein H6819_01245 [Phycisphaerales bacterium]|nr:hypothetical protein [Phycisphaerales bacterium]MCB9857167.1 hypothetical protein [Phycisphaerales bacterium]